MTGFNSKRDAAADKLQEPAQSEKEKISREMTAEIAAARELAQPEQKCWCTTCRPITMDDMRFVVCPDCGNKRCPKANDHRNACTNSNEVGQKGSSWEHVKPLAQPEQKPTYTSTQATTCAGCGEHKHTPLRIDAMGGYVCLTCIDKKLGTLLGEFGYSKPAQEPVAHIPLKALEQIKPPMLILNNVPIYGYAAEGTVAVYITPPQREPLTDEAVLDIADYCLCDGGKTYGVLDFARAIEAAQGIKENT